MLTKITLVDGPREMLIRPRDGVAHAALDMGFPAMREVVEDRPDDDGAFDDTQHHGASAVSLTITLYEFGGTRYVIDELRSFCHPRQRPWLLVEDDEWSGPRRIQLRIDQTSSPIERGRGHLRDVQVGWKAPAGVWESTTEVQHTITADVPSSTGRTYPRTYPWHYESTLSSGATTITNVGLTRSHMVARLYGPITAPVLENTTTGERLAFTPELVLGPGEYVEVSSRNRTAYLLSDAAHNRLGFVDFETSTWWQVQPGIQQLRYYGQDVSPGAVATVYHRPSWL